MNRENRNFKEAIANSLPAGAPPLPASDVISSLYEKWNYISSVDILSLLRMKNPVNTFIK
jgi:hypothetical protein